ATTRMAEALPGAIQKSDTLLTEFRRVVDDPRTRAALAYLGTNRLPNVTDAVADDPTIEGALAWLGSDAGQTELDALFAGMAEERLQQVVHIAELNARAFEDAAKEVDRSLTGLDEKVRAALRQVHEVH